MGRIKTLAGAVTSPLGFAAGPGQDARCVKKAFEGGINYFFFYGPGHESFNQGLRPLISKNRDNLILATGCGGRKPQSMLASRRKLIKTFGVEMFDVFFAEYVSLMDKPEQIFGPGGTLDELQNWKAAGWIRYVGASTHDRPLAMQLVADERVDVLMHRFNMAHRKAATEVFPAALASKTPIVAFTATRWKTLLEPPEHWPSEPPFASDCYRFCLAHRAVELVLTAPKSVKELNSNLSVLREPRMSAAERRTWERYGDLVYGDGKDAYETRWA